MDLRGPANTMNKTERSDLASDQQVEPTMPADAEPPLGSWLVTPRRGYAHHGIYAGNGQVVHYAGLSRSLRRGPVEVVPLADFCRGNGLWTKGTPSARYKGQAAVERARSRVGENRYSVMTNNCEHFCMWCLDGESRSPQIERWLAWPRSIAAAMLGGFTQIFGAGRRLPAGLVRERLLAPTTKLVADAPDGLDEVGGRRVAFDLVA
jgi:hypothetical protein